MVIVVTMFRHSRTGQRSIRPENGGILCPDERKFEKETAEITERIKQLEEKIVSCGD